MALAIYRQYGFSGWGVGVRDERACPVCGGTEWDIDYDRTADGERRVDRCAQCQWPPPGPHTVEEWRAKWIARRGGGVGGA